MLEWPTEFYNTKTLEVTEVQQMIAKQKSLETIRSRLYYHDAKKGHLMIVEVQPLEEDKNSVFENYSTKAFGQMKG